MDENLIHFRGRFADLTPSMNKIEQSRLIPIFVSLKLMAWPFPKTDYVGERFERGKECFEYVKLKISRRHSSGDAKKAIRFTHTRTHTHSNENPSER